MTTDSALIQLVHTSIVDHLVTEMFIKVGIVAGAVVVVAVAMVILWRVVGRK